MSVDFNSEIRKNEDSLEEKEIDRNRFNFFLDDNRSESSSIMRLDNFQTVMQYKSHYFDGCNRSYDYEIDNFSANNIERLNKHAFNFNFDVFEI